MHFTINKVSWIDEKETYIQSALLFDFIRVQFIFQLLNDRLEQNDFIVNQTRSKDDWESLCREASRKTILKALGNYILSLVQRTFELGIFLNFYIKFLYQSIM